MKKLSFGLFAAVSVFAASCNKVDIPTTGDTVDTPTPNLKVDVSSLQELGDDYVYEGWIMVDGAPVSTGTFSKIDTPQTFTVDQDKLDKATTFVLSIEPANDTDPAPAATKVLAGDFSGATAEVTSTPFLGDDFGGTFLLGTPTDGDGNNELSGVWFTGLELPKLADGWKYEGWVMFNGKPLTTGTFTELKALDDNAESSPYRGQKNVGPKFPGEDYINGEFNGVTFPTDLTGATVVISVEPYPDNSAEPFVVKPLVATVPNGISDHQNINFEQGPVTTVMGTITRM